MTVIIPIDTPTVRSPLAKLLLLGLLCIGTPILWLLGLVIDIAGFLLEQIANWHNCWVVMPRDVWRDLTQSSDKTSHEKSHPES